MPQQQPQSDNNPRRDAMEILSHAAPERLAALWASFADKPAHVRVRGPETGLVMVRARAGGGGTPFNLGEAPVTRATVRLAYALGRDAAKVEIAAVLDALFQRDPAMITTQFLAPLAAEAEAADRVRREEVAATKVDFFTMVRGDD